MDQITPAPHITETPLVTPLNPSKGYQGNGRRDEPRKLRRERSSTVAEEEPEPAPSETAPPPEEETRGAHIDIQA